MSWKTMLMLTALCAVIILPCRADQDVDWFTAQNQAILGHDGHITLPDAQEFHQYIDTRITFQAEDSLECNSEGGFGPVPADCGMLRYNAVSAGFYNDTCGQAQYYWDHGWITYADLREELCFGRKSPEEISSNPRDQAVRIPIHHLEQSDKLIIL